MGDKGTLSYKSQFGPTYNIMLSIVNYIPGNIAIQMSCWDSEYNFWEPYATLTVNFEDMHHNTLRPFEAYVDVNNLPNILEWIRENNLGEITDVRMSSGFCSYPLVRFNKNRLLELCPEETLLYIKKLPQEQVQELITAEEFDEAMNVPEYMEYLERQAQSYEEPTIDDIPFGNSEEDTEYDEPISFDEEL